MSDTFDIPLENLEIWLTKETVSIVEPLKAEGRSLLNNVRDRLDGIVESCDKLSENAEKEMAKDERVIYRRARLMYKLAKKFSEMIGRVAIPDAISRESLHLFTENIRGVLETIGQERGRWFPRISPYFIIDRRRFDVALKRTVDQFEEFRSFLSNKYAPAETVEDAFSMIEELKKSLSNLDEDEIRKKKTALRKRFLEEEITESQQRIMSVQGKAEVVELAQIKEEIEELNEKVKRNLRYLQKPFLKFQSLVLSASYSLPLEEAKKLDDYLSNPFEALAAEDEGYPSLKRILRKIEEVFAQGKLKLKSTRLRKAENQMDSILKDSLAPLQRRCKEALSKKQMLSTSGAIINSRSELEKLQEVSKDLRRRKIMVDSRATVLDNEIKEMHKRIEDQKRDLERTVLKLTNKNVHVTF